ncbi:acyl-CoA dehydrogenase family protein [Actinomadura rudentiformis]|uniref:Acyl-CoA dehydrogenase n=1 Tax=Actinomadura rudentiformis TaxID=359158 RepID=A0A6H9YCJ6_9ACTN|nr:acyl-CoA dehydrogenase family protein [Actinomadura rudentiformis]KAB2341805.1 acyl-CoA dehydrogenase [Actinomadura rudentiformis]
MRFSFTEDQRLLAETVREVLDKACPPETVRAAGEPEQESVRPGPAWRALAEVGLLGAHIPEEHGGLGMTALDTVLAYEETGWYAVPGPLVETAVAAPLLVPAEHLAGIAAGTVTVSVRPACTPYLPDADVADLLVAGSAVVPRAGVTLTPHASVDATRKLFTVDLDAGPGGEEAFDRAALATAAQLVGLGRRLREEAVGYAGQRRQFGKVIGSFQALKHQLADVAIALEFAAPLVYRAAYSLTHGAPTAGRDVSAAKTAASRAAHRAARTALQVHGAIGYTDELDLQLWLNRVWALRPAWGDDGLHRARLRAALLDGPYEPRSVRLP